MKLVVIDYPDWIRLNREGKARPVLYDSPCMKVLWIRPETKVWKFATLIFSVLVCLGLIGGVVLIFFTTWWIGLLVILFSWFPLRKGSMVSVKQEVLREATANPQFFQTAIKLNALRFLVREEDLVGIQHLDGDSDMAFLNLFGKP